MQSRIAALVLLGVAFVCDVVRAQPTLSSSYMPEWGDTNFHELGPCYEGVFPSRDAFRKVMLRARRHDKLALEKVLECSYSPGCDGAASELYGGELQRLLLAWGDIDFSRALRLARSRHRGGYHHRLFGDRAMRYFFPLTAAVLNDKSI